MAEPITDRMLGTTQIVALADRLEAVLGDGAELHTVRSVGGRLLGATLTERVALLRDALLADLQGDWPAFADVVWRTLEDERFAGWFIWPVGDAVAARALDESAPSAFDEGLDLLVALTPRLTSEFSLRPFLASDLHRTLDAARRWSGSADQHVRRLASEGTRPRLPWAVRVRALLAEPEATIPILDALYRDPCQRVRRSVANHLGDLAKDHPQLAVATGTRWLASADGNTLWVIRHGLRALIKTGHAGALALMGFGAPEQIDVRGPHLRANAVAIGGRLDFSAEIVNSGTESTRLMIDYVIHYRKARGGTSPKVFKFATRTLAPGEAAELRGSRSFALTATRVLHQGAHALELQVNGQRFGKTAFVVTGAS
jgi:3-methyladenine DNA glycosylase AlkC